MFASIKKWINIPIQIKPFLRYDGAGDKSYDVPVNEKCYLKGDIVNVIDLAGNEVVSKMQMYIDGTIPIKVTDLITYETLDYVIKSVGVFYDGKGAKDLWVVYL